MGKKNINLLFVLLFFVTFLLPIKVNAGFLNDWVFDPIANTFFVNPHLRDESDMSHAGTSVITATNAAIIASNSSNITEINAQITIIDGALAAVRGQYTNSPYSTELGSDGLKRAEAEIIGQKIIALGAKIRVLESTGATTEIQAVNEEIQSLKNEKIKIQNTQLSSDDIRKLVGDDFCNFESLKGVTDCLGGAIMWFGINVLVQFFGTVLSASASIFDSAISFSVTTFASRIKDLPAIQDTWEIVRDLTNIFFIFILLYAAVGMTLRLNNIDAKKIIVRVIIIALLINFSMFFTRVIIDASNLLAFQFYNAIGKQDDGTSNTAFGIVSKSIMSGINPASRFATKDKEGNPTPIPHLSVDGLASIAGTIFVIVVSSFVLLAGAIMLIIRIVSLVFLIIISPLAFLAAAFPGQNNQFGKWFSQVVNQCFFAPFYLMFLFISIKIIKSGGIGDIESGSGWGFKVSLHYLITIGFLLASLLMATKMGAFGASKAIGWAGKLNRSAFGTLTKLGKRGIGATANILSPEGRKRNKEGRQRIAGSFKDWKNKLGENWDKDKKGEGGIAGAVAKATARTLKFAEKRAPLGKEVGEFIRKPLSGASETLANLSGEAFGFKAGVLGPTRDELAEKRKREKDEKDAKKEADMDKKKKEFSNLDFSNEDAVRKFLQSLKGDEITKMEERDIIKAAPLLSANFLEALEKDMTADKFNKVMESFTKPLEDIVAKAPADNATDTDKANYKAIYQYEVKKIMGNYETRAVTKLSNNQLTNPLVIEAMSERMVRELRKNGKINESEFDKIETQIKKNANHPAHNYVVGSTGQKVGTSGGNTPAGTQADRPDTTSGIDVPSGGVGI